MSRLPVNDSTAVAVASTTELIHTLGNDDKDNYSHLAMCEQQNLTHNVQQLFDKLASLDEDLYIEKSHSPGYGYLYHYMKDGKRIDIKKQKPVAFIKEYLDRLESFNSDDSSLLAEALLEEININFELVKKSLPGYRGGFFSGIVSQKTNETRANFAPVLHQDGNMRILLANYVDVGAVFVPSYFNCLKADLHHKAALPYVKGKQNITYQITTQGKTMHNGQGIAPKLSPFHKGIQSDQRIIGIASTF